MQAGQDWRDPETWYGLAIAVVLLGALAYAHIFWDTCYMYC